MVEDCWFGGGGGHSRLDDLLLCNKNPCNYVATESGDNNTRDLTGK